jgi:tRNA (guanine-N7-)-methyltransferase
MTRKLKEYPSVALKPEDLCGEIDFNQVFGRSRPLHVEVGTGKATFLLSQAVAHPDINFLGIERANKYYRYAVDRIGRWARAKPWTGSSPPSAGLTNVRIIRIDAATFLADCVPSDSVDCFHIYFPDPWPKRRHHKRRFFCPANLENLIRCLKTGGILRIATDHAEYFEQIQALIAGQSERLEQLEFIPAAGTESGELTGTNYERKYIKDKRQIYTFAVRKK